MKKAILLEVVLLFTYVAASAEDITIKSLAFTALPYYSTTVYQVRPATNNTYCNSTGNGEINANVYSMPGGATVYGTTTTNTATNCTTTYQPAQNQQLTWRIVYNYNLVEGGGYRYELLCTANWRFSKCAHLIPGQFFKATITGSDMSIEGINGSGKTRQVKYHILAMAPSTQTESPTVLTKSPPPPPVPVDPPKDMLVHLRPPFATALMMTEPVTSVLVDAPTVFDAKLSEQNGRMILVKSKTQEAAKSYVTVTLQSGRKVTVNLISDVGAH